MTNDKSETLQKVKFRQVTEKFCATLGDNVVVMQTMRGDTESRICLNAANCPNSAECKNNI